MREKEPIYREWNSFWRKEKQNYQAGFVRFISRQNRDYRAMNNEYSFFNDNK